MRAAVPRVGRFSGKALLLFLPGLVCLHADRAAGGDDAAGEAELAHHLRQMLDAGWGIQPSARAASDDHFRQGVAVAAGDRRLHLARALTLTRQGRNDLALEAWEELSRQEPENLDFWAWKVRVKMISRQYAAALVDLVRMAELLPEPAADEAAERAVMRQADFLGRMFGYLDGPGAEAARGSDQLRQDARRRAVAALSPERRQAFEEGRAAVIDRYSAFQLELEEETQRSKEEQELERQQRMQALADERDRIERDLADLTSEISRLRGEQTDQTRRIDRDLSDAESGLSQHEGRLLTIRHEIDRLRADIATLIFALEEEPDPNRRLFLREEIRRLELFLARRDADYRSAEREALRANDRRLTLERERERIRALYAEQMNEVNRQINTLRRQERRLRNEQLTAARPPTGINPRVRYLSSISASFTSYENFPLEAEKARLLRSLER